MKNLITFGEIYLTIQTNVFLYYLRKLPVVKYLVSADWYSRYGLKRLFSLLGVMAGFIKDAIGENIGLLFWVYLVPSLIAPNFHMGSMEYFLLFLDKIAYKRPVCAPHGSVRAAPQTKGAYFLRKYNKKCDNRMA